MHGGLYVTLFFYNNIPECNEWKHLLKIRLLETYYRNNNLNAEKEGG